MEYDPETQGLKIATPKPAIVKKKAMFSEFDDDIDLEEEEEPTIQNYDLVAKYFEHDSTRGTVEENRKKLSYASQRIAIVILLRKIVRSVQEERVSPSVVTPLISEECAKWKRIQIRDLVSLIRKEHKFRESVWQMFGIRKQMKFPPGMDTQLFDGVLDFNVENDILLQNICVSKDERQDIKDFYETIGEKVVDMSVVYYWHNFAVSSK